ncbi:MAG: lipoprotein [Gammaproteobacteria bacterium]|nr:lipoprotein [Gammaproteobacteria bacterium]MCZ6717100.1 lipoprotein [Gammaproteobacteria bacterium]MCZ6827413.1 lipoprotein [Gammaproteobacteria bacterium]MCZ6911289.1 lipoprotein [Pseudomonadota bacterium]
MNKHTPFPVAFFAALLLLSGCGQTGDLYLPEDPETEPVTSSGDAQQPEAEESSQDEDSQDQP